MLRARLDCLGVFLVARDDERLFAAGKSGRRARKYFEAVRHQLLP